jgi:hypothetical protein
VILGDTASRETVSTELDETLLSVPAITGGLQDLLWNLRQGYDSLQNAFFGADSRHPVHGATRCVLPDRGAAAASDGLHTQQAVRSHSSHDDAHAGSMEHVSHREHHKIGLMGHFDSRQKPSRDETSRATRKSRFSETGTQCRNGLPIQPPSLPNLHRHSLLCPSPADNC